MATIDLTAAAVKGNEIGNRKPFIVVNVVDLSKCNSGTGGVQNDVVKCVSIPANVLVKRAGVIVDIPEGAAGHIDLGITGVQAAGFLSDQDLNVTAGTPIVSAGTEAYAAESKGALVTTADTIDLLLKTAHTYIGKVRVWAECIDLS